jgi:Abi-like protein
VTFAFADLERAISAPRAGRYLAATTTGGRQPDPEAALRLYEYNCRLSGAAWVTIGDIEITLRNIVATAVSDLHATVRPGGKHRWYDDPSWFPPERKWLTSEALLSIETAKKRLRDPGTDGSVRPHEGQIVAELTLGFWRYLLIARYEHTLWNPAIRACFAELSHLSGSRSRKTVHQRVEALNYLRNRVAHHEPIYEPFRVPGRTDPLDPRAVLDEATELIGWANPAASTWIASRSTFAEVQTTHPLLL